MDDNITNQEPTPATRKQQDYFREWYDLNRDYISAKRKKRYATDPAYREKCLEATRKYAAERAERRRLARLARAHDPTPMVRDLTPVGRTISIRTPEGKTVKVLAYRVGEIKRRLQRSRASITNWLKHGILPQARYMTPGSGFRLYTQPEVECIVQTYTEVGMHTMVPGSIQEMRRLIAARWKLLPQGLDAGWRDIKARPLREIVEMPDDLMVM
jgi:hypothetical protein